jgi:hypothetical protein
MQCPVDAFKSFQTLSGPLTELLLKPIAVNSPPFIASFAPRTVAPKLTEGGKISEPPGNSVDINDIRYEIMDTVIVQPIHKGFLFPDQQASQWNQVAELVIMLISKGVSAGRNKGDQTIAFINIPIFSTTNTSSYSAYLDQLYDPTKPAANLQTIFLNDDGDTKQKSISYVFCSQGSNIQVILFPRGIQLPSYNWQKLMNIIKTLNQINLPAAGLVVPTSQEFKTRFQYFMKPVAITGKFDPGSCPAYKTSQYKCVPFDRIRNLDGDTVIFNGAGTLRDRLQEQDRAKASAIKSVAGQKPGLSPTEIAAIVAGSLIGVVGLVYVGSKAAAFVNQDMSF